MGDLQLPISYRAHNKGCECPHCPDRDLSEEALTEITRNDYVRMGILMVEEYVNNQDIPRD